MLSLNYSILLWWFNTGCLMHNSLIIKVTFHVTFNTIISSNNLYQIFKLNFTKSIEIDNYIMSFRFSFHEIYPSKMCMIINNGKKVSMSMYRNTRTWSPNIYMMQFKKINNVRITRRKRKFLFFFFF